MPKRKTPKDYYELANSRDFTWLGPEVPNVSTRTWWLCDKGHAWRTTYKSIHIGRGCRYCGFEKSAAAKRLMPDDYHTLAESKGWEWLGPEVKRNSLKTWWRCDQGHELDATYTRLQQGDGCRYCSGNAQKTETDYHALAGKRGFVWHGPMPDNTHSVSDWECDQGHHWDGRYHDIAAGHGCPHCAGLAPKTPDEYRGLANRLGYEWLGPEVPNSRTPTWWRCPEGHRVDMTYASLERFEGCRYCSGRAKKTAKDYYAAAREANLDWVGELPPNIHTPTLWKCQLAGHMWETTYTSIYHIGNGCPHCSGKAPKTAEDYHRLASEVGLEWIAEEIPPTVNDKTLWWCPEGHIMEKEYNSVNQGRGCLECSGLAPKQPEDYIHLAEENDLEWLGPQVPNTATKTWWECSWGHVFETTYASIRSSPNACRQCSGLALKKADDYHALAEARQFVWLGDEVINTRTKTLWGCEDGHTWEAPYGAIRAGNGCPHCADYVRGARVSAPQRALHEMIGGILNHPFGSYNIDVALEIDGVKIAAEYDSWYFHARQEEYDAERDEEMIEAGWKVLRVKSNHMLPTQEQWDKAVSELLNGASFAEIMLDDWGKGPILEDTLTGREDEQDD